MSAAGFEARMAGIEALVAEVERCPDAAAREAARTLTAAVLELHAEGLARMVAGADASAVARWRSDPLIASLLDLHDVGPARGAVSRLPIFQPDPPERPAAGLVPEELCALCGIPIGPEHPHLIELSPHAIRCACRACALLFDGDASGRRFKRAGTRVRRVPILLGEAAWDALGVPVRLAFFFERSAAGDVAAMYPGPAGTTLAEPPVEAWRALVREHAALAELAPDSEALLVSRLPGAEASYLVPVDTGFHLAGLVRGAWRGVLGGDEATRVVERFLGELAGRAESA